MQTAREELMEMVVINLCPYVLWIEVLGVEVSSPMAVAYVNLLEQQMAVIPF